MDSHLQYHRLMLRSGMTLVMIIQEINVTYSPHFSSLQAVWEMGGEQQKWSSWSLQECPLKPMQAVKAETSCL